MRYQLWQISDGCWRGLSSHDKEVQPDPRFPYQHEIDLLDMKIRKLDKDDGKEPSPVVNGEGLDSKSP
jgi:hypothetical protein